MTNERDRKVQVLSLLIHHTADLLKPLPPLAEFLCVFYLVRLITVLILISTPIPRALVSDRTGVQCGYCRNWSPLSGELPCSYHCFFFWLKCLSVYGWLQIVSLGPNRRMVSPYFGKRCDTTHCTLPENSAFTLHTSFDPTSVRFPQFRSPRSPLIDDPVERARIWMDRGWNKRLGGRRNQIIK